MPATWSSLMARTNFKMAAGSTPRWRGETTATPRHPQRPRRQIQAHLLRGPGPEVLVDESVTAVHSAAGCHDIAHGGCRSCRLGRLPAIARLGAPASRLPHHSGADVLSRWQPRGHG